VLPLHESVAEPLQAAAESIADPATAEAAAESVADPAIAAETAIDPSTVESDATVGAALTDTSCLCV
jgi:hypothetical protein